jgi:hypothetical protein
LQLRSVFPENDTVSLDDVVKFIQQHFTDGLVTVIGSGLSAAEGLPGMPDLADYLKGASLELKDDDAKRWGEIANVLPARIKLNRPIIAPLSATRDFWREWGEKEPNLSAIQAAVETLRRQSRTPKTGK